MKMRLYHGSNAAVREPHVSQRPLDFGAGFYTTSSLEQAKNWAKWTTSLRGEGQPTVSVYEIDTDAFPFLRICRFGAPDRAWLDYVAENRRGLEKNNNYVGM